MGTVVPINDNFFAALNSAVFSDGSFVYIPKGVECPMELSSYFRINSGDTGQFERTLIIAEESSSVSYLEGCTAPMFDTNTLHAAVVELVALDNASIKYSTVQNWYAGNEEGVGGIYNFVTKRGELKKAIVTSAEDHWDAFLDSAGQPDAGAESGDMLFNSKISQLTEIADSPFYAKTVLDFNENSKAKLEFIELSEEIFEKVGL